MNHPRLLSYPPFLGAKGLKTKDARLPKKAGVL